MKAENSFYDQILTSSMRAPHYSLRTSNCREFQKSQVKIDVHEKSPDEIEFNLKISNLKPKFPQVDFKDIVATENSEVFAINTYQKDIPKPNSPKKCLNQNIEKIKTEFKLFFEINQTFLKDLKEFSDVFPNLSSQKTIFDFEKQFELFYRPFFWNVVLSNSQFREIVESIKNNLVKLELRKKDISVNQHSLSEYERKIQENYLMLQEDLASSNEESVLSVREIEFLRDKLDNLSLPKSTLLELKLLLKDFMTLKSEWSEDVNEYSSSKRKVIAIEEDIQYFSREKNTIDENNFAEIKKEGFEEFMSLYQLKLSNELYDCKYFQLQSDPHSLIEEFIQKHFKDISNNSSKLFIEEKTITNELLRQIEKNNCEIILDFLRNKKSKTENLMRSLKTKIKSGTELIRHFKLRQYKTFSNENLKNAFKIIKKTKTQFASQEKLLAKIERIKIELEEMWRLKTDVNLLLFDQKDQIECKEFEESILSKIDEVNKNFMVFCLNDLMQTNGHFQVIVFLIIYRRYNPVQLYSKYMSISKEIDDLNNETPNVKLQKIEKNMQKFKALMLLFSGSFYYSNLYPNCMNIGTFQETIEKIDFNLLVETLQKIVKSIGPVLKNPIVHFEDLNENESSGKEFFQQCSKTDKIKTILSKRFELSIYRQPENVIDFFKCIVPFLNGFKAYFRLGTTLLPKIDAFNPCGQNNAKKTSSGYKTKSNMMSDQKQKTKNTLNEKKVRTDFNPFLSKKRTPIDCGFFHCSVFFSLDTDEVQFIAKQVKGKTNSEEKNIFMKWSLPISFFKYPLISNNTKDFIDHIKSQKDVDFDDSQFLFELSLASLKFERVDLILESFNLFCVAFSFFTALGKDKNLVQQIKKSIILKI